ncbi:MAG: polyribonucleotide nucleotidyltransferase [Chlorobi bacterium]|nr:polyribonucleotide nucleotidyltransferase [Chlorobiota bacterium]
MIDPPKPYTVTVEVDGKEITIETGKLARQADGSALVRCGKTVLLATVVSSKELREGVDFFPLTVDYQEKFSAAGRFPGGFFKREGKLSEHEILVSRLVDRALRPLFPEDYYAETQVKITLFSADEDVSPDALAGLAASAAIWVSDIPFNGPMAEVRVARVDGKLVINPSEGEMGRADISIVVGGTRDYIVMVEGEMREVSEREMVEALNYAHEAIKRLVEAQERLVQLKGGRKVREYQSIGEDEELKRLVEERLTEKIFEVFTNPTTKKERRERLKRIKEEFVESLPEEKRESSLLINKYIHDLEKRLMRELILERGVRIDGRRLDEIRPIWAEVDVLPATHGSSVFTRGETQALATVTLGSRMDVQLIDTPTIQEETKFMVHYNFPPFSTGEIKPLRGPSRREIGHGNLAYRALKGVMPSEDELPYTVRVVSDILESNGSSSMATVCAGSLALMDAGVPIKGHVAGIAMGLIIDSDTGRYAILTDILGDEDHIGDMDFKVAGTREGITACQMDIKISGITEEILMNALEQALKARGEILDILEGVISQPRKDLKPHVPKARVVVIPKEYIGLVIGPSGRTIQELQERTGTTIYIEPESGTDLGKVYITGKSQDAVDAAAEHIDLMTRLPEEGEVYEGEVKEIKPFGALVEFMPGKVGLLHISEIDWKHIPDVSDVFKVGDKVKVKLIEIEEGTGRYKLSRKALLPKPEGLNQEQSQREKTSPQRDSGASRHQTRTHNRPKPQGKPQGGRKGPQRPKGDDDIYSF